jgi:hypothetical protein
MVIVASWIPGCCIVMFVGCGPARCSMAVTACGTYSRSSIRRLRRDAPGGCAGRPGVIGCGLGADRADELAGPERRGQLQRAPQLTLAGWPLYRHRDDDGMLATAGQNGVDGRFVVTPKGDKATPAA